jgi:glutathione S-transferase
VLYETSAIHAYVDQAFDGPPLQPDDLRERAGMNRWISALNNYYYPYIAYHLSHERLIYPVHGTSPDEKVVAAALPIA